jgi:uroporphyrinogen-III decarboxylase
MTQEFSYPKTSLEAPSPQRLLAALDFKEPDRVPHLEFWITSKTVYEYVLGRKLDYEVIDAKEGQKSIAPEDEIEFAFRIGMDAVPCNFSWRPGNIFEKASDGTEHYVGGRIKTWEDLETLESPPPLEEQLALLERYLEAGKKYGVGIFPNFTSFFDSAQLAMGYEYFLYQIYDNLALIEKLMDILLEHQVKVVEAVFKHYGDRLLFMMVNDDIAYNSGLAVRPELFRKLFCERFRTLTEPARKQGKKIVMHTDGKMDQVLPILYELGVGAIHPCEPESNDIYELKKRWYGKVAVIGNIHTPLLAYGSKEEIEEDVKEHLTRLAPGGGYVLSSSTSIFEGIPPENFLHMVRCVHRFGVYEKLRGGA